MTGAKYGIVVVFEDISSTNLSRLNEAYGGTTDERNLTVAIDINYTLKSGAGFVAAKCNGKLLSPRIRGRPEDVKSGLEELSKIIPELKPRKQHGN